MIFLLKHFGHVFALRVYQHGDRGPHLHLLRDAKPHRCCTALRAKITDLDRRFGPELEIFRIVGHVTNSQDQSKVCARS